MRRIKRAGLVAIAGAAIVPAWVAYVSMSPTGASAFSVGEQDVTDRTLPPRSRIPFLVRFMLGGILGLFVVGCLSAFFWVSVPTVILLRRLVVRLRHDVGHAVAGYVRIAADEFESFVAGLGNQQPVKRVAVVIWQSCDGQGVRNGHG